MKSTTTRTNTISLSPPVLSENRFLTDTRGGAATQIDFVNGMIILLAGILFYFAVSSLFLASLETPGPGDNAAAIKSADKLMGDVFLASPSDETVSGDCINTYFTGSGTPSDCDHNTAYWGVPGDPEYVQRSLSLKDTQDARVELVDGSGTPVYTIGSDLPSGNIGKFERTLRADVDSSGTKQWYTLVVYVW